MANAQFATIDAGGDAYARGERKAACSYPAGSEAASDWLGGWKLRASIEVRLLEEMVERIASSKGKTAASS